MASNLDTQRAINKLLADRLSLLEKQTTEVSKQLKTAIALAETLKGASPGDVAKKVDDINKALESAATSAENFGTTSQESYRKLLTTLNKTIKPASTLSDTLMGFAKGMKLEFPIATAAAIGFFDGMLSGFKLVINVSKAALGIFKQVVTSVLDISTSIAAIPFKIFSGITEAAGKLANVIMEIRQSIEEVRKEFGDLTRTSGKSVIETARGITGEWKAMGLSAYQVFGTTAEKIRYVAQTAKEMGSTFDLVRNEFNSFSGHELLLMQKGLGLTGEDMAALTKRGLAFGTTLGRQMSDVSKFAVDFSRRFGISQKMISRDIAAMVKDVRNFGSLAPSELAKVSVYARKLGVDFKDLLGVVDKFDTFESAAESAAKLSQAFGLNIDAVAMMKEQDPSKRVEMLRQAFLATGKSAEQLTRQERQLLSQTTGLNEETLNVAFSQKNASVAMSELDKRGLLSQKHQISQTQATVQLSESIERMVKQMREHKGFWDAFINGFARGVLVGKPLQKMFFTIYNAMDATYRMAIKTGMTFDSIFPGVKDMAEAITAFFDKPFDKSKGFGKMLDEIKGHFSVFFDTIGGQTGRKSLPTLMRNIRKSFSDYFDSQTPEGKKFIEGFRKFSASMGNIISSGITIVAHGIEKIVDIIVGFLTGKSLDIPDTGGIANAFWRPISNALETAVPRVVTALKHLWSVVWEKAKPIIIDAADKVWPWIASGIFGAGLLKSFTSVAATVIPMILFRTLSGSEGGIIGSIGGWSKGAGAKKVSDAMATAVMGATGGTEKAMKSLAGKRHGAVMAGLNEVVAGNEQILTALEGMQKKGAGINFGNIMKIGLAIAATLPVIAGGVIAAAYVIRQMPEIKLEQIAEFGAVSLALTGMVSALGVAGAAMSRIVGPLSKAWVSVAVGMGLLALSIPIVAGSAAIALKFLSWLNVPADIGDKVKAMNSLFKGVTMMLIPAAILGAPLLIPGVGLVGAAGVALMVNAGAVMLGAFGAVLTASLIPTINMLANVKVKDPDALKATTETMVSVIDSVSKFAAAVGTITSAIRPGIIDFLQGNSFSGMMTSVKQLVSTMLDKGFSDIVQKLIDASAGFEGKAERVEAAKIIAKVITSVTGFAGSMAEVIKVAGDKGFWDSINPWADGFIEKTRAAGAAITNVIGAFSSYVTPMIEKLLSVKIGDPKAAAEQAGILQTMVNTLQNVVNVVKGFKEIPGDAGTSFMSTMVSIFGQPGGIMKDKSGIFSKQNIEYLNWGLQNVATLGISDAALRASRDSMDSIVSATSAAIDTANKLLKLDADAPVMFQSTDTPAVRAIVAMVEEVNMLERSLQQLSDPIDLDARLEELGNRLGLKNKEFKIERSRELSINVNLNVVMETDKVADVLINSKRVKGRVGGGI